MIKRLLVSIVLIISASLATAQTNNLAALPGYYNFGNIPGVIDEPKVQIDINPMMLNFISNMAKESEPEAAEALSGIRGIKVFVYELSEGPDQVYGFIDNASQELEGSQWMRMVSVDAEDAKVRIHVMPDGDSISGMTLMVVGDDNEAVFMNIVGEINPAKLGQIAGRVGLDNVLDDLGAAIESGEITVD